MDEQNGTLEDLHFRDTGATSCPSISSSAACSVRHCLDFGHANKLDAVEREWTWVSGNC